MRAGPLTAEHRRAALSDVRWGDLELASSIFVTVRDEGWGSLRPSVRRVALHDRSDRFELRLEATHGDDAFAWRAIVSGGRDGTLVFDMEGEALREFVYRRIGICVLHPWATYVGASYEADGLGDRVSGTLPRDIAPQPLVGGHYQPLIPAFRQLRIAFPGSARASFSFEGEDHGYELEDQRNWTDASFKTYPTPLADSSARTMREGERRWQRLTVRVEGPTDQTQRSEGPTVLTVGAGSERELPSIGLTVPSVPVEPEWIRSLAPAHLRVTVRPSVDEEVLHPAASLARLAEVPLEVCLLVEDPHPALATIASVLADAPVVRVLVLSRSGESTGGPFVSRFRGALHGGSAVLVGGTCSHFSELNRAVPDLAGLDGIALAMSPAVHDDDERAMVETLEVQTQVVRRVRALCGGLPVTVSPVTLAVHGSTGDEQVDPRVKSPFGNAWTVGSVSALADGGARSVTLHEALDWTILGADPLIRAVRLLTARGGRRLLDVGSSEPRRVRAIATEGAPPVLVNLTPDEQRVVVQAQDRTEAALAPYEVALLDGRSR